MRQSQLNFDLNIKKSIQALHRNFSRDNTNLTLTFLPVEKQQDGHNCCLFGVAFTVEILEGKSPIDAVFHVPQPCSQLIYCLESGTLRPFPKI